MYVWLDLGLEFSWLIAEVGEKPYLAAGMMALALMLPLALTSTNAAMRLLGKRWRLLHRCVYLVSLFAVLHFLWLSKEGVYTAWIYAVIVALLLGDRLLVRLGIFNRRPIDDDLEAPERGR